jgi:hypothetical protein
VKPSLAGRLLRAVVARRGSIVAPLSPGWQREREIVAETRSKTRLLLTDPAAVNLLACARAAQRLGAAFAEAGVFQGGSARLICEEKGEAPLHLFDVFETLQLSGTPGGGEVRDHFGRLHGRRDDVERLLSPYAGVHFHPGLFPETTHGLEDLRFAFVHLDLDLPSATRAALEYFHPRLVRGAILVGDDYNDPAVKACFDDWFADRPDTLIEVPWSQLVVVRQAG